MERVVERQERSAFSSPVAGKVVRATFDGGRLTSDAGVLLLAETERRLGLAERLARCLGDPRSPERVRHTLANMIRFRVLLIAAGYPDANDCNVLRSDPAFKMALGRPPESGADLCSQPTMCRLENLPGPTALKRMMAAMVELFCDSFERVPRRTGTRRTVTAVAPGKEGALLEGDKGIPGELAGCGRDRTGRRSDREGPQDRSRVRRRAVIIIPAPKYTWPTTVVATAATSPAGFGHATMGEMFERTCELDRTIGDPLLASDEDGQDLLQAGWMMPVDRIIRTATRDLTDV